MFGRQPQAGPAATPPGSHAPEPMVVRDSTSGWSLTLPSGWRPVPDELIKLVNDRVNALGAGGDFTFTHGFTTAEDGSLAFPYILVQHTPGHLDQATYEDIEQTVNRAVLQSGVNRAEVVSSGQVQGSVQSTPTLDRVRGVATFDIEVKVPTGIGRGRIWMFFGRDGVTQLNCYADAADAQARLPEFVSIAASFAFDPGRAFTPATRPINRTLLVSLLAGSVGSVVAILYYKRRFGARTAA
ncbi:MAG: hypothetical protein GIKADHBN_02851 [Phycisphaerales bacterium]|nr:hypothetical protein [Phycisphaerales bacterium]